MTVKVSPDIDFPTHHISLSDGNKTIGLIATDSAGNASPYALTRAPVTRTAMKTTTGNAKYSDYEPPWTPIAQEDWSGGRGNDDFDKDTTRYYDGYRANTMFGKIMHGPQEKYSTGLRSANNNMPGNVSWWSLITGSGLYLSNKFIPAANYTASELWLLIRRRGTPTGDLTIEIRDNNSGVPGSVLQTMTVTTTNMTDTLSEWWVNTISGGQAVTASTTYWIVAYSSAGDDTNHWEVGVNSAYAYGKQSADGSTWTNSTVDMYYRVIDASTNVFGRFFQYKRGMYFVRSVASAASTLWINGDRGTADANTGALGTLVDASKSWTTDEWVGCYVQLSGGKGSNEEQSWRKITGNNGTTLTVDGDWEIEHDTTTEYVIQGSSKWTEINNTNFGAGWDTGLTAKVTDVLVVNNIIYFAQGDSVVIRAAKFETSAGTWTATYRDDGVATNKATYLQTVRNPSSGAIEIWRAQNLDANSKVSVSKSALVAWGANLAFGTTEGTDKASFEDSYGKITGLEEYGDTSKYLWVFREGTIYAINAGKPDEIPLREIRTLASDSNGKAHTIHNAYMYINLGGGLQQYYNRQMTDVGTNRDEGLPADRRGPVSDLQGYPGRLFEAVDAGSSGYSQVHGYNLTGWCELYRAPKGKRIGCIEYEVIPDVGLDRLWIQQGNDIVWIPFPSGTLDPSKDSNYLFTHEIAVVSGWLYAGLPDVYKLYNTFKLFAEGLSEDEIWVELDYQLDQETDWTPVEELFYTSPVDERDLDPEGSIQGKRFRYRIRSYTTDATKTSLVKSAVVECISRVPIKYSYAVAYRLIDGGVDLRGEKDQQGTPDDVQAVLDEWSSLLTRLTMRSHKKIFDNKRVFIDPAPVSIIGEKLENYTGKLTMIEV